MFIVQNPSNPKLYALYKDLKPEEIRSSSFLAWDIVLGTENDREACNSLFENFLSKVKSEPKFRDFTTFLTYFGQKYAI